MIRPALACAFVLAVLTGCTPAATEPVELVVHRSGSIEVDGLTRTYSLQAPTDAADPTDATAPVPLLIVMHGASGNGANIETLSGIEADGFIVAYPDGTSRREAETDLAWNAGHCCGRPVDDDVDDVAFITALVADIEAAYPVDPARIYLAGFSNGGMMAYRLACEIPDTFAGIAVVSGSFNHEDCRSPSRPLSVLIIHGTADPTLPYEGSADPTTKTSVVHTSWFWANANACDMTPVVVVNEAVTTETYSDCTDAQVQLVTIDGGTHVWSNSHDGGVDASAWILSFFALS